MTERIIQKRYPSNSDAESPFEIGKHKEHCEQVTEANYELQRIILNSGFDTMEHKIKNGMVDGDVEKRYFRILPEIEKLVIQIDKNDEEAEVSVQKLNSRLNDKRQNIAEINHSFVQFKEQIAENAIDSRNEKPLSKKRIEKFIIAEASKDAILEKERLRYVTLRSNIEELEKSIHNKEQLADGLSLIDFEQLQVENKRLYNQISDSSGEMVSLTNKHLHSKKMINRVIDKLANVSKQESFIKQNLIELEACLYNDRNKLSEFKKKFTKIRKRNGNLKQTFILTKNEKLAHDYESTKQEIEVMNLHLSNLKLRHSELVQIKP